MRRNADRPVPFLVELRFIEERNAEGSESSDGGRVTRTRIHAAIRPKRDRDRRRGDSVERAVPHRRHKILSDGDRLRAAGQCRLLRRRRFWSRSGRP